MSKRRYLSFVLCILLFVIQLFPVNAYAASNDTIGIETSHTYFIKNLYTGRYLTVDSDLNLQNVYTSTFTGTTAQKWFVVRNTDGSYTIRAVISTNNRVLDVTGTNVDIFVGTSQVYQKFTLLRDTSLAYGGTYYVKSNANFITETISNANVGTTSSASGLASMWSFQNTSKLDVDFYSFYYQIGSILTLPIYFDSRDSGSTIITEMGGLGYSTYNLTNYSAINAFNDMQEDDVWIFNGHGLETSSGVPLASIVFMDSNGNQNGYITPNTSINSGINNRHIDSLSVNALASEKCILYVGCSTGTSYTSGGISYNLVTSTFAKGAHFVLGTTQTVLSGDCTKWLNKFFEKAGDGGTIRQCIDNANYYNNIGLLYYEGDVYAKFN